MSGAALTENPLVADSAQVSASPKSRPRHQKAIVQALRLQQIVFDVVSNKLKPQEIAGLARAWCDLNEERRKLAMRPLPRPVDTTKLPRRGSRSKAAQFAPQEPAEPKTPDSTK